MRPLERFLGPLRLFAFDSSRGSRLGYVTIHVPYESVTRRLIGELSRPMLTSKLTSIAASAHDRADMIESNPLTGLALPLHRAPANKRRRS